MSELEGRVRQNEQDIVGIKKDINEVIPMKIDTVVGNQFAKYKSDKAIARKDGARWYKNQYLIIAAVVALIQAITKFIEAYTPAVGG